MIPRSKTYTPEQFENLPKWAQREIQRLENNVDHYCGKLSAGPEDSVVVADPFSEAVRPLGNSTIRFFPHGKDRNEEYVDVRVSDQPTQPGIEVRAGNHMQITPWSSNGVYIDARDLRFVKGRYA